MNLAVRSSDAKDIRRTTRVVRAACAVLLLIVLANAAVSVYELRTNSLQQQARQIENLSLVLAEHTAQTMFSASTALDSIVTVVKAANPQTVEQFRAFAARPVTGYPFVVGAVATASIYEWDWIRNASGIWMATLVSVAILLIGAILLLKAQRKTAQMRYLADHDALTGLPNRVLFEDRLTLALADARRNKSQCALIFVDLDHFKDINDTYGHAIGDVVLREVADRLGACVRDSDTIGRLGGDEFVLLLPDIGGEQGASRVAEKARQSLAEDIVIDGRAIPLSGSMGIAIYPQHGMTLSDLSNSADTAMYEAKANGRGTVRVFGQGEKR